MNTLRTIRVRLAALTVAGVALIGVAVAPTHAADVRPVMPLNGWSSKLGPGLGSVKTPFGVLESGTPASTPDATTYFHTSTGQAVQQVPTTHLGPGSWSSKSPLWSLYSGGSF